jgi:hypothetical protein
VLINRMRRDPSSTKRLQLQPHRNLFLAQFNHIKIPGACYVSRRRLPGLKVDTNLGSKSTGTICARTSARCHPSAPRLTSLHCLLKGSLAALRLFDANAVNIFESIFASGFIPQHIQVIIRLVALMRSARFLTQNLDDFMQRVVFPSITLRRSKDAFMTEPLSKDTSPGIYVAF